MTAPQTTKNWSISPNNRRAYTSLVDQVGYFVYTNKTRLLANMWTHVWSCDGTTGPTDASDHTDRITGVATFATRATVAAAAQSWVVLENPDGVQLMFCYQGASDDIARISYSASGAFTLAGTTTNQPTATDEIAFCAASSIVNSGTSLDRILQIWCAADGTAWRCVVFRNNALIMSVTLEKVAPIVGITTFPVPYVASKFTVMTRTVWTGTSDVQATVNLTPQTPYVGSGNIQAIGIANSRGWFGRVFTASASRACRMFGLMYLTAPVTGWGNAGVETGSTSASAPGPASTGGAGALCWPTILVGEKTANLDGPWGTTIDWYQVITNSTASPVLGDMMPGYEVGDTPGSSPASPRTNWWTAIGAGALWPWKNVAGTMEIV